jgi:hypothetical protein
MKHITLDEMTLIKIPEKNTSSHFVSTTATDISETKRGTGNPNTKATNMLANFCNTVPTYAGRVVLSRAKYWPKKQKDHGRGFKSHSGKGLKHRTKLTAI